MKKIFILLFLISTQVFSGTLALKGGVNFFGKSVEQSLKLSLLVNGEYYQELKIDNRLKLGGGLAIDLKADYSDVLGSTNTNFFPIYGLARYDIPYNEYLPYVFTRLGLCFNDNTNVASGTYLAFGVGLDFDKISAEVLWSSESSELKYKKLSLAIAYKFNLDFSAEKKKERKKMIFDNEILYNGKEAHNDLISSDPIKIKEDVKNVRINEDGSYFINE